ncbi:MAG: PQQ-binding-like beta-propeller repeat protein [Planctomycetota bacterium]
MHCLLLLAVASLAGPADWPQFRGPGASGASPDADPPIAFDAPTWRTEIPGLSHASPVIEGDFVFVATAIPKGRDPQLKVGLYGDGDSADDLVETEFRVLALDVKTGEIAWNTLVVEAVPPFGRHTKATQANSTPAVAGGRVVALFGSEGLFCLDARTGERRWHVDLGPLDCGPHDETDLEWGYASSPIIADGLAVVQMDVKAGGSLAAFDLETGEERWRTRRDDVNTWSTPTAVTLESGETHVLVNGCKEIAAYRLRDGKRAWTMAGGGGIPVPTPVVSDGLAYFTSNHRPLEPSHPHKPVFAVRLSATGDLGIPTGDDEEDADGVAWMQTRVGSYMQTPLAANGLVWLCYDSGIVTCLDARTGEMHYRERIQDGREGYTASPVLGGDRIYLTGEEGTVVVLAATDELEVVARGALGEVCMSTPAIHGDALVYRLEDSVARYD